MWKTCAKSSPSSELGTGDWAIETNKRGRPVRKSLRKGRSEDSPFVDSGIAVSDPLECDSSDVNSDAESIMVSRPRKRKRHRSSSLTTASFSMPVYEDIQSDVEQEPVTSSPESTENPILQVTISNMVINVPSNHKGPITLQLEMPSQNTSQLSMRSKGPEPPVVSLKDSQARKSHPQLPPRALARGFGVQSRSRDNHYAGFLDLPAELRNEIYEQVFIADNPLRFNVPDNFSRRAAFLRTCKQIHDEGTNLLYSQNHFTFSRNTSRNRSYWQWNNNEIGFKSMRRFLKSIGPRNVSLIRKATFHFEDATPCLNPDMLTADDRRFVYDDELMSGLRQLSAHGKLKSLDLHFHGRRRVERTDHRFLEHITAIQADEVKFIRTPPSVSEWASESKQEYTVEKMCMEAMVRKRKMYK